MVWIGGGCLHSLCVAVGDGLCGVVPVRRCWDGHVYSGEGDSCGGVVGEWVGEELRGGSDDEVGCVDCVRGGRHVVVVRPGIDGGVVWGWCWGSWVWGEWCLWTGVLWECGAMIWTE